MRRPIVERRPAPYRRLPSRWRAMKDFNYIWVIAVSFHFISPPIISSGLRYQQAWNFQIRIA
jgi:hypothetical protein